MFRRNQTIGTQAKGFFIRVYSPLHFEFIPQTLGQDSIKFQWPTGLKPSFAPENIKDHPQSLGCSETTPNRVP